VNRNVFLQARDGHCHVVGQAPLLVSRQGAAAKQIPQAIAGCEVLFFEPSMLRAADCIGRE